MKDKLLQMRVDYKFLSKLEYLRKINNYKSNAETVRKIVEKEYRKEEKEICNFKEIKVQEAITYLCPKCETIVGDSGDMPNWQLKHGMYCYRCGTFCREKV